MKKTVLAACALALSTHALSQTVIFADNFEMPSTNWTLNAAGSGSNEWTINASYAGSAANSIPDVPNQPGTFMNAPTSQYLHILNQPNCSGFVFVTCNASFDPNMTSNWTTEMSGDVSTVGYTGVALSFWYLCGGMDNVTYGTVDYSTDGGVTWLPATTPLFGVTQWTQLTLANPAFDGQSSLRFRFGWQNGNQGINPAFAIDELSLTGESLSGETITMQHLNASIYCPGAEETIGFEALGTYNAGNVFTAQLSDATGSFAAPVNIGTLASTATGILNIAATFPAATPAGTGYRVRVIASDPATTGGDNGEDVTFLALPEISVTTNPADGIICAGTPATLTADGATTYEWAPAGTLSSSTGSSVAANPTQTTTYTVTGTQFEGCTNTQTVTITVEDCAALDEQANAYLSVYPNPANELIHLQFAVKDAVNQIELLDAGGRVVRSVKQQFWAATDMITLDMPIDDLAQGAYTVRITHVGGKTIARFTKH